MLLRLACGMTPLKKVFAPQSFFTPLACRRRRHRRCDDSRNDARSCRGEARQCAGVRSRLHRARRGRGATQRAAPAGEYGPRRLGARPSERYREPSPPPTSFPVVAEVHPELWSGKDRSAAADSRGESWPRTWLVRVSATEAAAALATMMPLLNASCICSLNINYFSVICKINYSLHDLLKGIALTIVTILRRE